MARMPSGAVASMLENDATKNTIFFDDFTAVPFVVSHVNHKSNRTQRDPKVPIGQLGICLGIVKTLQNPAARKWLMARSFECVFHDERVTIAFRTSGSRCLLRL